MLDMNWPVRIVAVSDNHGLEEPIVRIRQVYSKEADYFFHLGDSEFPKRMLHGYACVRGNNDYYGDLPEYLTIQIDKYKILLCHGHHDMYWRNVAPLVKRAKNMGCQIVFFGHTHMYTEIESDGIILLNPGSIRYNRDGSKPTYMIVNLYEDHIETKRMEYEKLEIRKHF